MTLLNRKINLNINPMRARRRRFAPAKYISRRGSKGKIKCIFLIINSRMAPWFRI